ncbi:hypothetical protein LTR27_002747 [Elasticomyces elasticus]|nr:hypothetical protein LTR27_002747 [Elasticomyces elasticus]
MAASPRFKSIEPDVLIEEETLPNYRPEKYYPVRFGDTFNDRYHAIGKLGYGAASTVWLCKDNHSAQNTPRYIALKIYVNSLRTYRELPIYDHINSLRSEHKGRTRVRALLDSFELEGPDGTHTCLVHEACGDTLYELQKLLPDQTYPPDLLRELLRPVLYGLEFLHSEANIIHTDISEYNILVGIDDPNVFAEFKSKEEKRPVPRKILQDRTIYMSRQMPLTIANPKISDFSEARFASQALPNDSIMPDAYRAPENALGMPWSYPVDTWALVMMLWDLLQPHTLFDPSDQNGEYSVQHHLAQMVAVMGPPPLDFLNRSERSWKYWDSDGTWQGDVPIPVGYSLETAEKRLKGEDREMFLAMMRSMLHWRPEDRAGCMDIFWEEWMVADLVASGQLQRSEEASMGDGEVEVAASLQWTSSAAEIIEANPVKAGKAVLAGAKAVEGEIEKRLGDKITESKFQGNNLHKSSKDPKEKLRVVTVSAHTSRGTSKMSGHIDENGSYKLRFKKYGGDDMVEGGPVDVEDEEEKGRGEGG